jgi:NTE family protein
VLGAGGLVGMAYHAGVLRALQDVAGYAPTSADLIIGTSAGSVVGSYLRTGFGVDEMWELAMGTHPTLVEEGRAGLQTRAEVWAPMFRSPFDLYRRMLGSSYVLLRSAVRLPTPRLPSMLEDLFPAGMFSMEEGRRRLRTELPAEWPDRPLWLCTVDITTGRRVVLGRHGPPRAPLPEGVLASCAIPGVYRPVRIGRRTLVDGGVHSSSNLDLAAREGCSLIIGAVPMAFDPADPPDRCHQLLRRIPARALAAETAYARRKGAKVLLFRPNRAEIKAHGLDALRPEGLDKVAVSAFDAAAAVLESDRFREAIEELAA